MAMVPLAVTDWVTNSDAFNNTTLDAGNISSVRPPHINDPSSIIVENGSSLPVTSVGDTTPPSPFKIFYLFIALLLTIDVLWRLNLLAFL
jgi:hypothetical protein